MTINDPTHHGEHILYDCLERLGMRITARAEAPSISRWKLTEIIRGRSRVTPELAVRLETAFGSTARSWCLLRAYDRLAEVERRAGEIVAKRCVKVA